MEGSPICAPCAGLVKNIMPPVSESVESVYKSVIDCLAISDLYKKKSSDEEELFMRYPPNLHIVGN